VGVRVPPTGLPWRPAAPGPRSGGEIGKHTRVRSGVSGFESRPEHDCRPWLARGGDLVTLLARSMTIPLSLQRRAVLLLSSAALGMAFLSWGCSGGDDAASSDTGEDPGETAQGGQGPTAGVTPVLRVGNPRAALRAREAPGKAASPPQGRAGAARQGRGEAPPQARAAPARAVPAAQRPAAAADTETPSSRWR
jgi:hypothetical protein